MRLDTHTTASISTPALISGATLEMQNLARNLKYSDVLKKHRNMLKAFAEENADRVTLDIIDGKQSP